MTSVYDNETARSRLKYVLEVRDKDKSIAQAARDADVDWRTMKSWVVRFDREGIKGLLNKPRGISDPVSDEIKKLIVDLKVEKRSRSARKVRDLLTDNGGVHLHRQTIWRVLKDAGENKRVKKQLKVYRDFELDLN